MYDSCIRFHARTRPHAVAVSSLRRDVSFHQFDQDIDRVAAALADEGLVGAQLAAVGVSDPYLDCLLLVALTRLGVGTLTLTTSVADHVASKLAPDFMITDLADLARTWTVGRVLHTSADWLAKAVKREAKVVQPVQLNVEAVGRITLSSGTTGEPKVMIRSWRQVENAVSQRMYISAALLGGAQKSERLFNLFGFDTIVVYHVLATWAAGGALVLGGKEAFQKEAVFYRLAPTKLAASPLQLQTIMSWLPADFTVKPELTIITGGSHLPATLANVVQLRVTPSIWNIYASSEVDVMAMGQLAHLRGDPAAAGWLAPNVDVEIVDGDDVALPFGEQGSIRVRTPSLVGGYHGSQEATTRHFKDGWFYPGDVGSLSADGLLRVEGRADDLMNFGGLKILPHAIEAAVLTCPGVEDVAAFAAPNEAGLAEPWLAIVRGEGFDEARIATALKTLPLPTVHMVWIKQIPRNERGKVQRDRLRTAIVKPKPIAN